MHCFLISTLAEYQTYFWLKVGHALKEHGYACEFISFDDRSTELLRKDGFTVYSLHDMPSDDAHPSLPQLIELFNAHSLSAVEGWCLHERVAYGEQDQATLLQKLYRSIRLGERAIHSCKKCHKDVSVIQEVGGFLSVIGCYAAAKKAGVANWFIEPAFFKGRLFFTRDSFAAPSIRGSVETSSLSEVKAYIDTVLKTQQIVIP